MNMTSTSENVDGGDSGEEEIGRFLSMKEFKLVSILCSLDLFIMGLRVTAG